MINAIVTAIKNKDIRTKLLLMLAALAIVRIGSCVPLPWVNRSLLDLWFSGDNASLGFLDAITGGAMSNLTLFALSVAPYITASIIIELLSVVIPRLEELSHDGAEGKKDKERIIRYTGIGLALLQAASTCYAMYRQGLFEEMTFFKGVVITLLMTAGSTFLIFMGEWLTKKGFGSGISFILLVNILSRVPQTFSGLYEQFINGKGAASAIVVALIILLILIGTVVLVIYLEGGQRSIPINNSMSAGRTQAGGTSSIPLKVNMAGVIPVIFASTILSIPALFFSLSGSGGSQFTSNIAAGANSNNWFRIDSPILSIGYLVYIALLFFFAYFYTGITFNSREVAGNLKRSGSVIPGIRPGQPTQEYLDVILKRLIFIGACGLAIVATIPILVNGLSGAKVSFSGTSLIIVTGVILDIGRAIEGMLIERGRKGFLK